jgi:hypothetical protein
MPDTQTLETINPVPTEEEQREPRAGDRDGSAARRAAAIEANYILEALRG